MSINEAAPRFGRQALRFALGHQIANGLAAALGLLLVTAGVHLSAGEFAASAASVGAIVCIPPDLTAPRRGKLRQLLPAALIGLPLFFAVQLLHAAPIRLGLLLVPATFLAFLGAAWGRRGLPISVSIMFAMIFSMAVPEHRGEATALVTSGWFAVGAVAYLAYAKLYNTLLNGRYRVQMLAETLLSLAGVMRTQARQFTASAGGGGAPAAPSVGRLLLQQAALTDLLQSARDLLLESPRTKRRQRLAGLLLQVLDMRDLLLSCELDLDLLQAQPGQAPALGALREVLGGLADAVERTADALLLGRRPAPYASRRAELAGLRSGAACDASRPADAGAAVPALSALPTVPTLPAVLARGLAVRIGNLDGEVARLVALARGEAEPDLAAVRVAWRMFISPAEWSWQPLASLWHPQAPPLRHALRGALAVGGAYALSLALPWGTHDYWILLTIVVVLRGSLAQTLERRDSRVAGTLLGCLLTAALLSAHPPAAVLVAVLTLAQAIAHAFAIRRYLVTAVAATVLGLVQAHLLGGGGSPVFDVAERIADTLIGVAIAWGISYVLPSWERLQLPAMVARTLAAQARHARVALGQGQLQAVDNEPEVEWRLARREAYDSLSALVQATQRSLAEPRAVRPPLEPLARLLAHSYQLQAQLTAVKATLLLHRERLDPAELGAPLARTAAAIAETLTAGPTLQQDDAQVAAGDPGVADAAGAAAAAAAAPQPAGAAASSLPDPFESDLGPWVLRRLELAGELARQLRDDAQQARAQTA